MKLTDSAGQWLRLMEHYRKLTDEELLKLARRPSALTDDAQQVLRNQMFARRLGLPPEEPAADDRPAGSRVHLCRGARTGDYLHGVEV